ncbi:MAG: twin-arginine translocase TatA/TatE family subunit [Crocinitomicaceae bacterium]|nr:twin-arginine translocase TatA/TatE family subunit [Crocinitomicaceae bacterium]
MLLFLNDIAGSEVLVILAFILMFFGSKSIPGIARSMGSTIRQIKEASNDLQNEIKKSGADMKNELNLRSLLDDTVEDLKAPLDQYVSDLEDAVQYEPVKKTVQIQEAETVKTEDKEVETVSSELENQAKTLDN